MTKTVEVVGATAAAVGHFVRFLLWALDRLTPAVGPFLIWLGTWMYDPRLSWIVLGVMVVLLWYVPRPKGGTK